MKRVLLRQLSESDIPALAIQANNKKIWLNLRNMFPHPYSEENAKQFVAMVGSDKKNTRFAIEIDGRFAGMIGIFPQEDVYKYNAEIGYWLGEEFWGQGIGTEAVQQMCSYCFSETETKRIFAGIFSYNAASMRVLEKCGFVNEGIAKEAVFKNGSFHDELRYALVKS